MEPRSLPLRSATCGRGSLGKPVNPLCPNGSGQGHRNPSSRSASGSKGTTLGAGPGSPNQFRLPAAPAAWHDRRSIRRGPTITPVRDRQCVRGARWPRSCYRAKSPPVGPHPPVLAHLSAAKVGDSRGEGRSVPLHRVREFPNEGPWLPRRENGPLDSRSPGGKRKPFPRAHRSGFVPLGSTSRRFDLSLFVASSLVLAGVFSRARRENRRVNGGSS